MFSFLFVFTALLQPAYAPPIHSNTNGVTECQDALEDWYKQQQPSSIRLTCSEFSTDMETLLGGCRPSDTVRMLAIFETIYFTYSSNQLTCGGSEAIECTQTVSCMEPLFATRLSDTLACTQTQRLVQDEVVKCLIKETPKCAIAGLLIHTVRRASEQVCKGSACVTPAGVFQPLPGTSCTEWGWTYRSNPKRYTFTAPAGTMFSADDCGVVRLAEGKCYN